MLEPIYKDNILHRVQSYDAVFRAYFIPVVGVAMVASLSETQEILQNVVFLVWFNSLDLDLWSLDRERAYVFSWTVQSTY